MHSAFGLLSFIVRSENRVEALKSLEAAPASRAELQEATEIPRASLSRILADFQARDLADREGYEYSITPLGRLLAGELRSTFESLAVGSELQSLTPWLPLSELGIEIEDLVDARITLPTPVDPLAPVDRTAAVLESCDRVRGLCNNVIPDLLETLSGAGAEIEVVTTTDAFDVVSTDPRTRGAVREMLRSGRLDLTVSSEWFPQLAIAADGTILLEVTDDDGAIHGLIESETDAVRSWFASAFDGYGEQAERIAPELLAT